MPATRGGKRTAEAIEVDRPSPGRVSPRIAVVVPARNEATRIAQCLRSLHAQTLQPAEILVVDGESTDSTRDIALELGARVVQEDQGTRAAACDIGLRATECEFVAFTDADCVTDPRWLETLHREIARTRAENPHVVGVGCTVENVGDEGWALGIRVSQTTLLGSGNSIQGRQFATPRYVRSISGCNSLYVRAAVIEAGGFRTELRTCEDTELNHRLRRAGGQLLYTPGTIVRHDHRRGMSLFARRMFQYGAGRSQAHLFGLPVLVPLAAPVLLAVGAVFPVALGIALSAYALALLLTAVGAAARHKNVSLLWRVPAILAVQHASYTVGFWAHVVGYRR